MKYTASSIVTVMITATKSGSGPVQFTLKELGIDPSKYTTEAATTNINTQMVQLITDNPNLSADDLAKLIQANQKVNEAKETNLLPAAVVKAVYNKLTTDKAFQGPTADKKLVIKEADLQIAPHEKTGTFTVTVPSTWGF